MSSTNAKIAQKLEACIVTMEMLVGKMRDVSTTSFENTMSSSAVANVKSKLDTVDARLSELHDLMQTACATSTDTDVLARSGSGSGK